VKHVFSVIPPIPDLDRAGKEMHAFVADLFPICRSLTGPGVRETLQRIQAHVPLGVREIPSGTPLLDWTAPPEWAIRDAWIKGPDGRKVVDFRESNLHVVGYSVPLHERMPLDALQPHLHSLPEQPDWIPYRTSYYGNTWGFCLAHRLREALPEGEYEVFIDSGLDHDGALTYGELVLPGTSTEEVLISAHVCHPSLANDNLSGIAVATFLARHLEANGHRFTYRFLFGPGTLGSIAWLAQNPEKVGRIRHGLVLSCLGDAGGFTYKRTVQGGAPVDRAVVHVLKHRATEHRILDFSPYGYDERQYNSPGFRMPVGCLMRSMYGTFPEYHTSADNLAFVRPEALAESLEVVGGIVDVLENDRRFRNLLPRGEPQLGRRGLYDWLGGQNDRATAQLALLWVLNLADGDHSLLDIAERAELPFATIREAAAALLSKELLAEQDTP
jgi:aminopeptidase-like protein